MSKKNNPIFSCSKCGAQFPKWTGRCLTCGTWGTVNEEAFEDIADNVKSLPKVKSEQLINLAQLKIEDWPRLITNVNEFDRVLGGGLVKGSLILLGGEPGIGKSTLILQICQGLSVPLLYVSGEESANQIKIRSDRLNLHSPQLQFLPENNIEKILAHLLQIKPQLVIIDSIQTMYSNELPSEAGSINQVRICTVKLLEIAKKYDITMIIIGHVTKDGQVAGPKSLEHLVDAVLYLEGSTNDDFRLLRCTKNRFGSTNELGVFAMTGSGLIEVANPSELFLPKHTKPISGSVTTCILEGSRPFLIEIQALSSKTLFGYPQRKTAGFDLNRLQMLTAVLIKRANVPLVNQDIHLNVTGGLKINETAADLAVCMAIISSYKDIIIPPETLILGEVGLGGEIRPVYQLEKRVDEGLKMKYKTIITPPFKSTRNNIVMVEDINQAIKKILT